MLALSIAPSKLLPGHGRPFVKSPTRHSADSPSDSNRCARRFIAVDEPSIEETLKPSRAMYQVQAPGPQPRSRRCTTFLSGTRYQLRATKRITYSGGYLPHSFSWKIASQVSSHAIGADYMSQWFA